MNEIPNKIICKVTANGSPSEGILLIANFGVISKNSYSCIFGPTDRLGVASLEKSTIIHEANETLKMAIMDYHPIESAFSGKISIRTMSSTDIARALEAYKIYRDGFNFRDGYEAMLKAAAINPLLQDFETIDLQRIE